jgi:hypothetical protein
VLAVVAVFLGSGLWLLRWSGDQSTATPDTFWYARDALRYAGYSQSSADTAAAKITCGAMNRADPPYRKGYNACVRYRIGLPDRAPIRFQRIFTSRPGYALLTTPFVWVLGGAGFLVGTAVLGVACGVAIAVLGLVAGLRPGQALLAEAAFYLLPSGLWASRMLAEAPMMLFLSMALIGTVLLLRGYAPIAAVFLLAVSLTCLFVVKPANGVALAAALTAGAVMLSTFIRARSACLVIAAVAAVALAGYLLVSTALHLPGTHETLQDTFTRHFRRPDVADPWHLLADHTVLLWQDRIAPQMLNDPLIPAAYLLGAAGLFGRLRRNAAWPLFLAGLTGAVVVSMHPLASETPRLAVVTWIPVALGLAALLNLPSGVGAVRSRLGPFRRGGRTARAAAWKASRQVCLDRPNNPLFSPLSPILSAMYLPDHLPASRKSGSNTVRAGSRPCRHRWRASCS